MINTIDWAIEWCNRKSADLFEMDSRNEFIGDFGHHYHVDPFTEDDITKTQRELDEKGLSRSLVRYRTKKGNLFWGLLETRRVKISKKDYQIVKVIDISENPESWAIQLNEDITGRSFNHLIKNNLLTVLSLLKMKMRGHHDEDINSATIKDVYRRINTIAVLHEQLTYQSDEIELVQYLNNVLEHIRSIHDYLEISLDLHIPEIQLNPEDTLKLGMIVNELDGNSINHAFHSERENTILITIDPVENDSYAFQYQDNGDGSKKVEEERKQGGGLGLRVVERLTADLGGEWNAKIDQNGFLGGFTFPLVK
ncbi:MAG: hypothetical protein HRT61_13680 [Ekhidna sp.]|nr:hypothetical protein [Ekhidna sp.]